MHLKHYLSPKDNRYTSRSNCPKEGGAEQADFGVPRKRDPDEDHRDAQDGVAASVRRQPQGPTDAW